MYCKGIIAPEKGKVCLADVPVEDPKENEVQVRMASTMISPGTERAHILALPNANQNFPYVPGYCCAGYVEKVGAKVTGFRPGDRVCCFAEGVGHRQIGNVVATRVAHIPDGMPFDYAAFNGLAQTSMQGVRKCGIELGESVLVYGLGIVGQLALQFAKANGACPAIGAARDPEKLRIAEECGADLVLNCKDKNLRELVAPYTKDGAGPSVVLDCTGSASAFSDACDAAANYARVCILGCPRGVEPFNFYRLAQLKSLNIIGAHAVFSVPQDRSQPRLWTYADDIACYNALVMRGSVNVEPLITSRIDWQDATEAYEGLLSWNKGALAVIIHWCE